MRLTEITLRSLKPAEKQRTYFDGAIPGFGVRVNPGGTKSFVLMHGTSRQLTTLGRHGIITLQQARAKAREILAQRTLGHHRPPTITFEEAFDLFKTTHCAAKRPRTARDYERILNLYFLPKLRREHLEDITTHILVAITDKLGDRPGEQAHAQAVARTFFRWAVRRRYIMHSPLEGIQIAQGNSRDRVLDDAELTAVYRVAQEMGYPFGTIVQLLVLTGQRRGEIAALRLDWIDFEKRMITIPASITKNGRQHAFPFGKQIYAILKQCPSIDGSLFPARGNPETVFSGWSKCKRAMDNTLEDVSPWTLHDLRRTFSSGQAALGTPPHITERILNHVSGTISGVAAIYNRFRYVEEMRVAMTAWETHVAHLVRSARPSLRIAASR